MNIPARAAKSGFVDSATPLLFVLLWSTGFIGAKFGLPYAGPMTFLTLRFVAVLALVLPVALLMRAPWPDSPRAFLHIAVAGLLVHGVYLSGVFIAIGLGLPSGIAALIVGLQPLITAFAAGILFGERVSPAQWAGLALGFTGVVLVVAGKIAAVPGGALFAMLVPAFAALAGITAGTLYQKRFCPSFDLRTGAIIQYLPCLVVMAMLAYLWESMEVTWSGSFVFALAWLVVVLSVGAVALLNLLIRKGSAVNVASLFYLTPPATALIAWIMFGETLTGPALAGMALAAAGVWLARQRS
ncbi:putative DMT superfamily transporter inner membrane protein [Pigmentiphaga humi]|uniref:Putative DMT superfamily transporter inner membrane protein n=1 Tax=Pigmentiphaga humi TaxID=2478468 RepID=A0A3P4BAL4_9BURK|nr:DMT family transporter [Pigmentiphaga humi]VCU72586.1 putative DMT superfamily transporter inner membrane protein [Pigmentiphaga humi]